MRPFLEKEEVKIRISAVFSLIHSSSGEVARVLLTPGGNDFLCLSQFHSYPLCLLLDGTPPAQHPMI